MADIDPEDRYMLQKSPSGPCGQTMVKIVAAAWLGMYMPSLFIIVQGATTASTDTNVTTATPTAATSFNFLNYMPQSAISLVSLAAFIGMSVGIAWLAEKLYERLSLRDDSSDMSEHTKEILRARILGMVFAKKLDITMMSEKDKQKELVKKYAHLWQYKAAMKRNRRKEELKKAGQEKRRKSSVFGGFFSSSKDKDKDAEGDVAAADRKRTISKKPTISAITEDEINGSGGASAATKTRRETVEEDFVAIDIKPKSPPPAAANTTPVKKTNGGGNKNSINNSSIKNNSLNNKKKDITPIGKITNDHDNEFDFSEMQDFTKKQDVKREGSMHKYVRPPSSFSNSFKGTGGPNISNTAAANAKTNSSSNTKNEPVRNVSRPLTAGRSRPITAGASSRQTSEYKSQGNSVRKEVLNKKLAQFD